MRSFFVTMLTAAFFSCITTHKEFNLVGEYIGYDRHSSEYEGYTYFLKLNEDSTFLFEKSHDLYKFKGVGVWSLHNYTLTIAYNNENQEDVLDALIAGGHVNGCDTIKIKNVNTFKMGDVVLKRICEQ